MKIPDRHVPALDGVRGLAILAVIVHHAQMIWGEEGPGKWLNSIFDLGTHGVDLFFVLSGFLITGILDASRDSPHYFRNFYIRRALRIFPLYYLFLAIAFFVQPHLVHKPDVASGHRTWFWLYASNFLVSKIGWFETSPINVNITWSLAIEEQFYVFWPLVVLLFRGIALRRICICVIAASTLFRLVAELMQAGVVSIYVLTPSRLDALAWGAWSVLALRDSRCLDGFWIRYRRAIGTLSIAAGSSIFVLASRYASVQPLADVLGFLLFSIGFSALLLHVSLSRKDHWLIRFFTFYPLRMYGKFSYFLYLFHWAVLRACVVAIRVHDVPGTGRFGIFSSSVFVLAAFSLPLIPAWLSWNLFEKQLLKLKRFFPSEAPSYEFLEKTAEQSAPNCR